MGILKLNQGWVVLLTVILGAGWFSSCSKGVNSQEANGYEETTLWASVFVNEPGNILDSDLLMRVEADTAEVSVDDTLYFTGGLSDSSINGLKYYWRWGDGTDTIVTKSLWLKHSYSKVGIYSVTLLIEDLDVNYRDSIKLLVVVTNDAPVIGKLPESILIDLGDSLKVDVPVSDDGEMFEYSWYFDMPIVSGGLGDSTLDTVTHFSSIAYQYSSAGVMQDTIEYLAMLLVADEDNNVDTASIKVSIALHIPQAKIIANDTAVVGDTVTLFGDRSIAHYGARQYIWTIKGQSDTTESSIYKTVFEEAGIKDVKLQVIDSLGSLGRPDSVSIDVSWWQALTGQAPWENPGLTGSVRLTPGRAIGKSYDAKMTYRHDQMDGRESTCQYLKADRYMDSKDNQYLVGVATDLFDSSRACGKCLLFEYKGKRSIGVIADRCPGCKEGSIDANKPLLLSLQEDGVLQNIYHEEGLTVTPVACNWEDKSISYFFTAASNTWHWFIIILWSNHPITHVYASIPEHGIEEELIPDPFGRYQLRNVIGNKGFGTTILKIHGAGTDEVLTDTIVYNGESMEEVKGTGVNFRVD